MGPSEHRGTAATFAIILDDNHFSFRRAREIFCDLSRSLSLSRILVAAAAAILLLLIVLRFRTI